MSLAAIGLFLARNWRLLLPLAGILAVLAVLAYGRIQGERAEHAIDRADRSEQTAKAHNRATEAVERTTRAESERATITDQAIDELRELPDAQKPIDPERRSRLCDALGKLFDGRGGCDPVEPSGAVSVPSNQNADAGG